VGNEKRLRGDRRSVRMQMLWGEWKLHGMAVGVGGWNWQGLRLLLGGGINSRNYWTNLVSGLMT